MDTDKRMLSMGLSFAISILDDLAHGRPVSVERIEQTLKVCRATLQKFKAEEESAQCCDFFLF